MTKLLVVKAASISVIIYRALILGPDEPPHKQRQACTIFINAEQTKLQINDCVLRQISPSTIQR